MQDVDSACSSLQNSYVGLHQDEASQEQIEGYLACAQDSIEYANSWCSFRNGVLDVCDSFVSPREWEYRNADQ